MTAETNPPNLDVDLDVTSPEFKIAHDRLVEVIFHHSARGTENPDEQFDNFHFLVSLLYLLF